MNKNHSLTEWLQKETVCADIYIVQRATYFCGTLYNSSKRVSGRSLFFLKPREKTRVMQEIFNKCHVTGI